MNLIIIAAIGKNNELGKDNKLIWHLPNDLKFFKNVTSGKTILMGKNTFLSLPKKLVNRKHIVLSKSLSSNDSDITVYSSLEDFLKDYENYSEDIFVIGGASVYKSTIDLANMMYLTHIDEMCNDADTFFPTFNESDWEKEEIGKNTDNGISYKHVQYKRKF